MYGGAGIADQIADLKRGADIVVCTPGRMIDILTMNAGRLITLQRVTYVVLDEVRGRLDGWAWGHTDDTMEPGTDLGDCPFSPLSNVTRRTACLTWALSLKSRKSFRTRDRTAKPSCSRRRSPRTWRASHGER